MTASENPLVSDAGDTLAWLPAATTQRLGAEELARRTGDEALILGVAAGSARVLAREICQDGRLGPAVPVASARVGEILVVAAGGNGLRIVIRAAPGLQAVVLAVPEAGDQAVEKPEHLFGQQFGGPQETASWLTQVQGENEVLPWSQLLPLLPDEARRRAEEAVARDREAFARRLERSGEFDDNMLDEAVRYAARGARVAPVSTQFTGINPLDSACRFVAEAAGGQVPDRIQYEEGGALSLLEQFARAAHLHRRTVLLQGHWWNQEAGPLLAFRQEDRAPVALLPIRGGYEARLPASGDTTASETVPVDDSFAATLDDHAEMFYAGLPARAIGLRDILRFVVRGNGRDALMMLLATLATSALVTLIPVITGMVVDSIIPRVAVNSLVFVGVLLLAVTAGRALLHVVAGFAFLRIETRSSFALMAAFVDRLLELPTSFYRGRSAGDLTYRVMAIEKVRSMFTQSTVSVGMSFLAGTGNLVVLFVYDAGLAIWGVALALLQVVIIGGVAAYLARRNYELSVEKGRLDGMTYDVIRGIRQVRVQGSRARILARLLQRLVPVAQASYRIGIAGAANQAVLVGFQGATLALVFAMFTSNLDATGASPLSDGGFVVFITALTAFFGSTAMLGPAISSVAEAIPQYYRLKPIMDEVPEVTEVGRETHRVLGDLSVRDVVFRYADALPPVLDGVSLDIRRGEFVAIVGRSGCGKSTLMRVMLGLEKPESGSVLFDGTPLANLDPSIVRSQLGVVMQSNSVLPGSVQSTILGVGSERTLDDAWAAARMVGMESEIDAMPMGMLTIVGPMTLSSSQAQRLMIARAMVTRPSILLLDEATSTMDNLTQDEVAHSIDELASTRVVIAHRLSTIRKADRIYVLQDGKVVQTGSFEELAASEGHFRELMAGQLS